MNGLRIVGRAAVRARPTSSAAVRAPVLRRSYADVASDKIKLSLTLPHQVRMLAVVPVGHGVVGCRCGFRSERDRSDGWIVGWSNVKSGTEYLRIWEDGGL